MAISGVLRPGYVQVRVLDMKAALEHYRDRIGLDVVMTGDDGRVYLKAYDEFDHHSLILREADEPGMDFMSFKVMNEGMLDELHEKLLDGGVAVEEISAGGMPSVGRRLSFIAPTGHRFELFASIGLHPTGPMVNNPELWHAEPRGMRALRFDHCLLYGDDIDGAKALFMDLLGFAVTEQVVTPDGTVIATFLSCGMKAHDLALVRHDSKGKLHHVSFYLESWHDVGHAADIMSRYNMSVDIGPTRHGITRGQTIYFFDPSGNRNETFHGGYIRYPDHPVITWTHEETPKGIFYYGHKMVESFVTANT